MKKLSIILTMVLAVGFVAASALVASANKGPAEINMTAKRGNVHFNHADHQGKIASCTECHHKGLETPKCTSCHGAIDGIPTAKKIFHTKCKGCHKESGGPTKCKQCHIK